MTESWSLTSPTKVTGVSWPSSKPVKWGLASWVKYWKSDLFEHMWSEAHESTIHEKCGCNRWDDL